MNNLELALRVGLRKSKYFWLMVFFYSIAIFNRKYESIGLNYKFAWEYGL